MADPRATSSTSIAVTAGAVEEVKKCFALREERARVMASRHPGQAVGC